MKKFIRIYFIVLIIAEMFLIFGGFQLFDFYRHFFIAGAACSFVIALIVFVFSVQSEKIEKLEKRLNELEKAAEKEHGGS